VVGVALGWGWCDYEVKERLLEVIGMSDTTRSRPNPLRILNSDGRSHPLQNALAVGVLVVGLVSFVVGVILRNETGAGAGLRITATATGLVSLAVGLYAQMVSATREQRVLIVTGIIAGFVGLAIGLGRGGF
jgi:hypothetical protein